MGQMKLVEVDFHGRFYLHIHTYIHILAERLLSGRFTAVDKIIYSYLIPNSDNFYILCLISFCIIVLTILVKNCFHYCITGISSLLNKHQGRPKTAGKYSLSISPSIQNNIEISV